MANIQRTILILFLFEVYSTSQAQTDTIRIDASNVTHKKVATYAKGKKTISIAHFVDGKLMDSTSYANWTIVEGQKYNRWMSYYKYGDSCYVIHTGNRGIKLTEGWFWGGDGYLSGLKEYFTNGNLKKVSSFKLGNANYRTILNDTTTNGKIKKKWKNENFLSIKHGYFIEYDQKGSVISREKNINGIKVE